MTTSIDLLKLTASLQTLIDEYTKQASNVEEFIDPVIQGTPVAELKVHLLLYVMLDHCKSVCTALIKMCNKNMPIVAERAEKLMTQDMMDSITFMGKTFKPDIENYISVIAALKPLCIQWLKDNPDSRYLISEGYHPASFDKFIEEQFLDKGLKDNLPQFVSVFPKKTLNVRKVRGG